MKILHVVGARPNFMKIAPIVEAIEKQNRASNRPIDQRLVHTGQHYDARMSELFFNDLGIPKPDINLDVGSGTHAEQTAEIMKRFEKVCLSEGPTHLLVVGDVNSTIACALVAAKLGIKVIHVEAGLRSFNRSMPEEINRILTDAISDLLFVTERSAEENLRKEGIAREKIHFVGNVMIDTLLKHRYRAARLDLLARLGLKRGASDRPVEYGLLTLHRPSNVDDPEIFSGILEAVAEIAKARPILFPVHPRTRRKIAAFGLPGQLRSGGAVDGPGLYGLDPLGYLEFLCLMSSARIVLTDSGGIQEETTVLGVPCVTLREETERPVTLTDGTNILAGVRKEKILEAAGAWLDQFSRSDRPGRIPPLWDGRAAERIVAVLNREAAKKAS